jgi:flagellar protein FliO/FliZ
MSIHDILTVLAALAAVIVMILLARFGTRLVGLARRRGLPHGVLSLEASLSIDPRRRLSLVDCQGHRLLLLTGGPSDLLLGWLPPSGPPPQQPGAVP